MTQMTQMIGTAMAGASLMLLTSGAALGQSAADLPAFEVASVKPTSTEVASVKPAGARRSRIANPAGITYTSVTLKDCIVAAYQVKSYQISGSGWLDSEGYDISARTAGSASNEQLRMMLQTLLADRFKLALHREKGELPVYALVVGKHGPKLHAVEAGGEGNPASAPADPKFQMATGSMVFQRASLASFAEYLSRHAAISRPVLDMTGLKGFYDITLKLFDNPADMSPIDMKGSLRDWREGTAIFTQVQEQLGLKLESQEAPVEILIIDHAEKVPTEN